MRLRLARGLVQFAYMAATGVALLGCLPTTCQRDVDVCRANLKVLAGTLVSTYSAQQLADLFSAKDPWERILADYGERPGHIAPDWVSDMLRGCPSARHPGVMPYLVNRSLRDALKQDVNPVLVPIIWDRPGNHPDLTCVAFLDGHVEVLDSRTWQQLLTYLETRRAAPVGQ